MLYTLCNMIMTHAKIPKNFKPRRLKAYEKRFPREWAEWVTYPEIRLAGKWLEDLGVECGMMVTVTQEENRIVITFDPA